MPAGPHPTPPSWLVVLAGALAVVPFAVLGDLVEASDRATVTLRVGVVIVSLIAVLLWRALHRSFGSVAARVGIVGLAFFGFVAMTLLSRMAAFPDRVFALPFLFPVWLAALLFVATALTERSARRRLG
ncbi:hypothetical protein [Ornithinimicrobium pratense]|uniref:Uncharacterized protein n=1 Tax=Ornithinimicrobium pratense TaxID=2593973 RepID=A0A5J6V4I1_9MICO|nr:hypothetical protein [Ornithinimicrobium pratense]QFG68685.1 hypothetical protein FY030_08125 [Ornithinimicrobium pratense]